MVSRYQIRVWRTFAWQAAVLLLVLPTAAVTVPGVAEDVSQRTFWVVYQSSGVGVVVWIVLAWAELLYCLGDVSDE